MPIAKKTTRRIAAQKTQKQKAIAKKRASAKAAARTPAKPRKHDVPAPTGRPADSPREYQAIVNAVLQVLPQRGPGMAVGEVYDAVHRGTSRRDFPGDTSRMWAKQVMLDLKSRGILEEGPGSPATWRKR